jgi:hypothetical protein
MSMPEIVSQDEWTIAREAMGDKEQAAAESRLELAAERRRMPMVRIDKEYRFEGPDGQGHVGRRECVEPARADAVRSSAGGRGLTRGLAAGSAVFLVPAT